MHVVNGYRGNRGGGHGKKNAISYVGSAKRKEKEGGKNPTSGQVIHFGRNPPVL
jgi:hypothetical protein